MTRYERAKHMSIEEIAKAVIAYGMTDAFCKDTCKAAKCVGVKPDIKECIQCCINWLNSEPDEPECRVCGCTEFNACAGGCYWVEPDLCSRCAE
jgi:hypothetical protein